MDAFLSVMEKQCGTDYIEIKGVLYVGSGHPLAKALESEYYYFHIDHKYGKTWLTGAKGRNFTQRGADVRIAVEAIYQC